MNELGPCHYNHPDSYLYSEPLFSTGSDSRPSWTGGTNSALATGNTDEYVPLGQLDILTNGYIPTSEHVDPQSTENYSMQLETTDPPMPSDHSSSEGTVIAPVTTDQMSLIPFSGVLKRKCEEQRRFPNDREIEMVAELDGLNSNVVRSCFERCLSKLLPWLIPPQPQEQKRLQHSNGSPNAALQSVRQYARNKFNKTCDSAQAKKAPRDLPYRCTSGCGYTTDDRDAWQRHEQTWQPQRFWNCVLCGELNRKPFICSRKDKFLEHLEKEHRDILKADHERYRVESNIDFDAGFEKQCKFGRCSHQFKSWEDRTEHYLRHFRAKIPDGPWELKYSRFKWFDDDDDDDENDQNGNSASTGHSGSTSHTSYSSNPQANTRSGSGFTHGKRVPGRANAGTTKATPHSHDTVEHLQSNEGNPCPDHVLQQLEGYDAPDGIVPHRLIDVQSSSLVRSTPDMRYLALDCSLVAHLYPQDTMVSVTRAGVQLEQTLSIEHLPRPFEEAVCLTKEMGYHYLWIADLCADYQNDRLFSKIFKQAVLTVVLARRSTSHEEISHFTCHYKNLDRVRSWAKLQSTAFMHVQYLGHGTFGVVDQVKLLSTQQFFARKMLLGSTARKLPKPVQVHEIEIMQKLQHPNIAQFVAAYFHRRSLNILMTPVAECNLNEFLVEPFRWPEHRQYLGFWFEPLASALSYMHDLSCRHKDIKPANILISGHNVLLSDFGTSFDFSASDSGSHGAAFMTPRYCAPEVANKSRRGRKADVWSLGCVFLEMATVLMERSLEDLYRHLGFDKEVNRRRATYHAHLDGLFSWLDQLSSAVESRHPRMVIPICKKMLQKDPSTRPTAAQVHRALIQPFNYLNQPKTANFWRPVRQYHRLPPRQRVANTTGHNASFTNYEPLHSNFVVQNDPKAFFVPGKALKIPWSQPAGEVIGRGSRNGTTPTGIQNLQLRRETKRFVVVRPSDRYCDVFPITSYSGCGTTGKAISLDAAFPSGTFPNMEQHFDYSEIFGRVFDPLEKEGSVREEKTLTKLGQNSTCLSRKAKACIAQASSKADAWAFDFLTWTALVWLHSSRKQHYKFATTLDHVLDTSIINGSMRDGEIYNRSVYPFEPLNSIYNGLRCLHSLECYEACLLRVQHAQDSFSHRSLVDFLGYDETRGYPQTDESQKSTNLAPLSSSAPSARANAWLDYPTQTKFRNLRTIDQSCKNDPVSDDTSIIITVGDLGYHSLSEISDYISKTNESMHHSSNSDLDDPTFDTVTSPCDTAIQNPTCSILETLHSSEPSDILLQSRCDVMLFSFPPVWLRPTTCSDYYITGDCRYPLELNGVEVIVGD